MDRKKHLITRRVEFLTRTIPSEPQVENAQTIHESEMALFYECMQKCAQKRLTPPTLLEIGMFR